MRWVAILATNKKNTLIWLLHHSLVEAITSARHRRLLGTHVNEALVGRFLGIRLGGRRPQKGRKAYNSSRESELPGC
jgi:hypothetical protein